MDGIVIDHDGGPYSRFRTILHRAAKLMKIFIDVKRLLAFDSFYYCIAVLGITSALCFGNQLFLRKNRCDSKASQLGIQDMMLLVCGTMV